jgi:hypothetical protein
LARLGAELDWRYLAVLEIVMFLYFRISLQVNVWLSLPYEVMGVNTYTVYKAPHAPNRIVCACEPSGYFAGFKPGDSDVGKSGVGK